MVVKRVIALTMVMCMNLLLLVSYSFAEPCRLPPVNTEKEILFSGFDWYIDYPTLMDTADKLGIEQNYFYSGPQLDNSLKLTPHWKIVKDFTSDGSERGCGARVHFYSNIPDVAGYPVRVLTFYMMWNPAFGRAQYNDPDALQMYMTHYEIIPSDTMSCYKDIKAKLMDLYGENPSVGYSVNEYACWVNAEGAFIGITYFDSTVDLYYMAPKAESRLCQTEKLIQEQELNGAQGDYSGL